MKIVKKPFGITPDGIPVDLFTLENFQGVTAKITNYGGIVVSLLALDSRGEKSDIVLGYETLGEYIRNNPYFGCIVGRYANRIAGGRFTLEGKEYILAKNNGENHLHGGMKGFDKVVWKAEDIFPSDGVGIALTYLSPDGEEGYPGNLSVKVRYILTTDNELRIEYSAVTDSATVVNLTHHSYFNLAGAERGNILNHELLIRAGAFTPIDQTLITTGEIRSVEGTPLDFTRRTPIVARINQNDEQLRYGQGYDHNWVLDNSDGSLSPAAQVVEPESGRTLEVFTTEPGIQFYSGNFLDGSITGKKRKIYNKRDGFCLETQHFPDSVHKPHFPSTVLRPGEEYSQTTVYRFEAE
ncbi:MAG: aldose epimerase family protein [Candidatus Latescibacter sp.]|nr:aldose epimerase family protein [Candidatus Latescibacter sp.]